MLRNFSIKILIGVFAFSANDAFAFGIHYERTTERGQIVGHRAAVMGTIGDYLQLAIPISALVYSSAIGDWEGDKQLAYSVGSTWAATEILKTLVHEERPDSLSEKGRSFPSGHSSFAFSGAAYWQMRYGWYIGAPMYVAASFVGYSRVVTKMHNPTDVIAGAALGIGFNYLFTSRYNNPNTQISVAPVDGGGAYLSFKTKF